MPATNPRTFDILTIFFHKNFNLNFGLCETLKRLLAVILGYFETIFDFPTQFDVVEMHFKMYSRNILSY